MRLTKVFFGDKRLKDIYVGATKFEVFKYRMTKLFKRVLIFAFIIGLAVGSVYGGYQVGKVSRVDFVNAETIDISDKNFAKKVDNLKMQLVDELMNCESPGYKDEDGLITYDPHRLNKDVSRIASIGRLQFKVSTIIFYQKSLYNAVLTPTDAIKLALDTPQAKVLAKEIMFKSSNMANDWLNCESKLNLNNRIKLIKQLEK